MKLSMSKEQIQLTAVHAVELPRLRSEPVYNLPLEHFHGPLASMINHLRELGQVQLIARPNRDDARAKDFPALLDTFIAELLDTVQLPGEKIGFEIKISEKTGLIVITLFKESA